MRLLITLFILISLQATGQSKKELTEENTKLKAESAKLKSEIEQLKKPKEADLSKDLPKVSYSLGTLIGYNLKAQGGDSLDIESIAIGLKDVLQKGSAKVEQNEAQMLVQQYLQQRMETKSASVKTDGEKFLNENKTKEGVKTTPSGLQYKVLTSGNGKQPTSTSNVTVHYTGKLLDGTEFDSSVRRGQPATFSCNGVISGWTEVLQLMHEGDKWMVYIPYNLGYGERGNGPKIPPYSTLVFEIELIKVN